MKNRRNVAIGGLSILALMLLMLFSGVFSIAEVINEKGSVQTVDQAFQACNEARAKYISQGSNCDPCELHCPSTAVQTGSTYSFSYPSTSRIYAGDFTNLQCDKTARFGLLEVKSDCNDAIRICTKQVGSGSVLSAESVSHGDVQKFAYSYQHYNCESGVASGSVFNDNIKYQLVCDSGYYVSGIKVSSSRSKLGDCRSEDSDFGEGERDAYIDDYAFSPDIVEAGNELSVTGKFIAGTDGSYYVYSRVDPDSVVPLSVVTGGGNTDLCGNEVNNAGKFFNLKDGDTALFSLTLPAPDDAGKYDLKIGVKPDCRGGDLDFREEQVVVLNREDLKDAVIEQILTEEPEFYDNFLKDLLDGVERLPENCSDLEMVVEGCQIAECVDGSPVLLDPVVCVDGSEIPLAKVQNAGKSKSKLISFGKGGYGYYTVGIGALMASILLGMLIFSKGDKKKRR